MKIEGLTPRELEVCGLVAEGYTAPAIAEQLGIHFRTVEGHIHSAARQIPGPGLPMRRIMRAWYSSQKPDQENVSPPDA